MKLLSLCQCIALACISSVYAETTPFGSTEPDGGNNQPPVQNGKAVDPFAIAMGKKSIDADADGIFLLTVDLATLDKMDMRSIAPSHFATSNWWSPESSISWDINIPAQSTYRVEITWATNKPGGPLNIVVNGKQAQQWKIGKTESWFNFHSERIATLTLPAGAHTISLNAPKVAEGYKLDVSCIRLIPTSLDGKIEELKKKPRLGMTMQELELLWGVSFPRNMFPLDRKLDNNDTDWHAFGNLKEKCRFIRWRKENTDINAALFNDRCIALEFKTTDHSPPTAINLAGAMLPGIRFAANPNSTLKSFTAYSTDKDKTYKLQFRNDGYFNLQSAVLVRQYGHTGSQSHIPVTKEDIESIYKTQAQNATAQNRPELIKKSRIGMTRAEINLLMGGPGKQRQWGDGLWLAEEWRIGDMRFITAYQNDVCYIFVILTRRQMPHPLAFKLAESFLDGYRFQLTPRQNLRESFKIYSTDDEKRYQATWSFGWENYTLEIFDTQYKRTLDRIRLNNLKAIL